MHEYKVVPRHRKSMSNTSSIKNNALERNLMKDANKHSLSQDTLVKDLDKKQKDAL